MRKNVHVVDAREAGVRIGQGSEFSLLLAHVALSAGFITPEASYTIQAATIISFGVFFILHCKKLRHAHRYC